MREVKVWERTDAQIKWLYGKETIIECKVRVAGCHRDLEFDVDEWMDKIRMCNTDEIVVPLDAFNMLILDLDDVRHLIMVHREEQFDLEELTADVEYTAQLIAEELEEAIQARIDDVLSYSIDDIQNSRDAILRGLERILDDVRTGCF